MSVTLWKRADQEEAMTNDEDHEAACIDIEVSELAEREGITKYDAYEKFLQSPPGLRSLARLRKAQGRSDDSEFLAKAADRVEQREAVAKHAGIE